MADDRPAAGGSSSTTVRARRTLIGSSLLIVALLLLAAVMSFADGGRHAARAAANPSLATGTALAHPPRVPAVTLTDAQGHHVSLRHWRSRWIVLVPAMTSCAEVCPMTTGALMRLSSRLRRDGLRHRVAIVEATVDPWRDTPQRLRAYRRLTGADFAMLTGSTGAIRRLWRFFGVAYRRVPEGRPAVIDWLTHHPQTFDVQHTDGVFIIGPRGRERVADEGMPDVGGHLSRALRSLLDAQGRRNLAHPQLSWTAGEVLTDLKRLNAGTAIESTTIAPSREAVARGLQGSPRTLAALHRQAGRLLGSEAALTSRLRALRGYPVVIDVWASWCTACRAEAPLIAQASARYGRRVAFVGLDADDSPGPATVFLRSNPVSYPSYAASSSDLGTLGMLQGLPTMIFVAADGNVVGRHLGQYDSERALVSDFGRYFPRAVPSR